MTGALIAIGAGVACGFWASSIGKKKGRSPGWCFVWGFLFGLIGVLVVACLKKKPLVTTEPLTSTPPVATGSTADELQRVSDMRTQGALTDEEFAAAKAKLLS